MRPCDHLQFDNRDRVACPNEGTSEVAGYWFCPLHIDEAWESYSVFLEVNDRA